MFKIVLFDLDGTLIDSSDDICDSVNFALNYHDREKSSKKDIMCHVGVGAEYLIEHVLENSNETIVDVVLKTYLDHYSRHSVVRTKLYDGVADLLKKSSALYGVITNKPSSVGMTVLNKLEIGDYLKWKIFADTYSVLKPDPCAIIKIFEETNVSKKDILYVGDTGIDLKFAENAGVSSCLFHSGFGAISTYSDVKPDFNINSIKELVGIVSR